MSFFKNVISWCWQLLRSYSISHVQMNMNHWWNDDGTKPQQLEENITVPVLLWPPEIPCGLAWDWTEASTHIQLVIHYSQHTAEGGRHSCLWWPIWSYNPLFFLQKAPRGREVLKYKTNVLIKCEWRTAAAQWLRCCATKRKVASSIPDGVTGIFHLHKPSNHTMTLGSTQSLTEMSTKSISWGQRQPVHKADYLTTILCPCHIIWEP